MPIRVDCKCIFKNNKKCKQNRAARLENATKQMGRDNAERFKTMYNMRTAGGWTPLPVIAKKNSADHRIVRGEKKEHKNERK